MAEYTKKHWSGINEAGTVMGMKALLLVHRFLGQRGFRIFLYPVMFYYYVVRKEARLASNIYLQKIKSFLPIESQVELSSFRHFIMFGEVLLDKFLAWMGQFGKEDVVFETPEVFVGNGRGGIIIVSHLGNAEICGALMEHLPELRITALVHTEHAEKFNSIIKKVNSNNKVSIMQVTEMTPATAMLLAERVGAGEYIIIAGDRTPVTGQQRVSHVEFFSAIASLPQGGIILASLLKCPVFLMFCLKRDTRYHVYIEKFSDCVKIPRQERAAAIDALVQRYARRLEHYCLMAPLQWFNFFPFWESSDATDHTG